MPPTEHARLSASGAALWMNCPGSVHMKDIFPDETSPAAEEGTLAHALAEVTLLKRTGQISESLAEEKQEQIQKDIDEFYSVHPDLPGSFEEVKKYVTGYTDFVLDQYQKLQKESGDTAYLYTEQKVSYEEFVPGGKGTSDVILVGGSTCVVIDLKYGRGVPVSAVQNPQIRLYACGAVRAFQPLYDFEKIRMIICQPRLHSITEEAMSDTDLRQWAEETAAPAARRALAENPEYHPGEWCHSHFCPGRGLCRARAEVMKELAGHRGQDPALLTPGEMGTLLTEASEVKSWISDLETAANDTAIQQGKHIPGWKVVEGQSRRKISDDEAALKALERYGYNASDVSESKLLSLSKLERKMGTETFHSILDPYIVKPSGAPKLVPESDRRKPVSVR